MLQPLQAEAETGEVVWAPTQSLDGLKQIQATYG